MVEIFVDADACPVKDEVLRVAARHAVPVTFVANFGLRPSRDPMIRNVLVPQGPDAADDWIVEKAGPHDVVVTADIGLAGRALENDAQVLGSNGRAFTRDSIGMALALRDLNKHLRETGESRGLNASFTARDRSAFLQALDEAIGRAKRQSGASQ